MNRIPVFTPTLDGNELRYVTDCVQSGWISSEGPYVGRLEKEFAAAHDRKHGIAVCNGTAALEIAVEALRLKQGDEVIMPTFTIISCASSVVRAGATPVLVDCDARTWNMKVDEVERAITPRTKAIMAVHIYGLPVDLDPIFALARKHNLPVIEDTAEEIGGRYKGKRCGSFGDISAFSFYANKHVTTGEGGMLLTDDDALAERCRSLRNLCFQKERRFVHEELGWNMRMCNLQAAIGVAQLERLEQTIARKKEIGVWYTELLADFPLVELPLPKTDYSDNIYWIYGIVLSDDVPFEAPEAAARLSKLGIDTRPFFWCMHEQPVFQRRGLFKGERHPVSERIARRGFYVPNGLGLEQSQIEYVAESLKKVLTAQ
jgi:perosamine synthetase